MMGHHIFHNHNGTAVAAEIIKQYCKDGTAVSYTGSKEGSMDCFPLERYV